MSDIFKEKEHISTMEAEIDIRQYFIDLWKKKMIIMFVTFIVTALTLTHAILSPNVYEARSLVTPNTQVLGSGKGLQMPGIVKNFLSSPSNSSSELPMILAQLRSRTFLLPFIMEEGIIYELFHEQFDAVNKKWIDPNPENHPTPGKALNQFRKIFHITEEDGNIYSLSIQWTDPKKSAMWVNKIVKRINKMARMKKINKVNNYIVVLKNEINRSTYLEIKKAVTVLFESELKNKMLAQVNVDYVFTVIDPAIVPEKWQKIRPKRSAMVILGFIAGLFGSIFIISIFNFFAIPTRNKQ
jgi:LPS O-antigen subunit length determinant protein (WzzB/FepE family)